MRTRTRLGGVCVTYTELVLLGTHNAATAYINWRVYIFIKLLIFLPEIVSTA